MEKPKYKNYGEHLKTMIDLNNKLTDIAILSMANSGFAPLPFLLLRDDLGHNPNINAVPLPYFLNKKSLVDRLFHLCKKGLLDISKIRFSRVGEGSRFDAINIRSKEDIENVYDNELYHIVPTYKGGELLTKHYGYQWGEYILLKFNTLTDFDDFENFNYDKWLQTLVRQRVIIASKSLKKVEKFKLNIKINNQVHLDKEVKIKYWKPNEWTILQGEIYVLIYHTEASIKETETINSVFLRYRDNLDFIDKNSLNELYSFVEASKSIDI